MVAMGKLGGREMTAASDLDLIVIYELDEAAIQSDGARPLAPTQYYTRFTQRLISALSAPTAEGALYEVDMRLRRPDRRGRWRCSCRASCIIRRRKRGRGSTWR